MTTTTTTIPSDINLVTTTLPTTTQDTITLDTTTPIDITTEGVILIIMMEVHTAPTTLDIIQDTAPTVLDIRMGIIKDIMQTIPTLIRIIPATKHTILTIPLTTLLIMTGSTTKDITKADTTIILLLTTELMMLRQTSISKWNIFVIYCQVTMKWCQPSMEDRYKTEVTDTLIYRLG
jgi:hypothetical protein